ncbi:MAG TPA: F0F1 ATP synthase subunit B [Candidatus Sulfotelmatobacter sp.]|nr:F0F1 ATP synthase subunit B [Candidatus Sulfotelmatobacter sp.]
MLDPKLLADSSSGIGALGFNLNDFLIQLVTFVLALIILKRYAFTPIANILRKRKETIEHGVKLEEDLKKEKAELDKKVDDTLRATRVKADGIISDAKASARQTVKDAEDQARVKADAISKEAEAQIALSTDKARKELEGELVGLISEVSSAVIEEKVDSEKDAKLIERSLKERTLKEAS